MKRTTIALATLLCVALLGRTADDPKNKIPHIGPTDKVEKVQGDFKFTEGPASDKEGNLYFSDTRDNKIYKLDAAGKISVVTDKSNQSNGLQINARGEIVVCEMDGAVVALSPDGKERRVIADKYEGKRFNAPNDLVLDQHGGIYFTDPTFNAPRPAPQAKTCVYYVDGQGKVTRLTDDLPNPNGVILAPDEKTLYVIPSGQKQMMAYPVESPGKLGNGKVFCELKQKDDKGNGGGDGLAIDTKGNLYITSGLGVQVFDAQGKHLGTIEFPEVPANCEFGGKDNKTLYVTARTSLYRVPMEATGHTFPGKK